MAQLPQNKSGYLRGVRGLVVTRINSDGTPDGAAVPYGIKTAQQVGVSVVVESGNATVLRGGDKVLAYVKDPDTVVAVNLAFQNARFDAKAIQTLAGGTLIEVAEGTDTRIVGWEAPTIEAQQNPPYFKAEVYAVNHSARGGGVDGYIKYTFYYCRATFGNETLQDQNWVIPEMNIECLENPSLSGGVYKKEFVAALPAELS